MMLDPSIWDEPAMRQSLARRDMPAVYWRLVAAGVQHRRIAELTGQLPSEIHDDVISWPRPASSWLTGPYWDKCSDSTLPP